MGIEYPYQPIQGSGTTYAPNAGAADITLKKGARQYCVSNLTGNIVYVRVDGPPTIGPNGPIAGAHAAATIADQAVLGNASRVFSKAEDSEAGSVYCAGVGSVQVSSGIGN